MALYGTTTTWIFDMKRRPDEIDPVKFPQLFYLLWYKTDLITPLQALEAYECQWRFVNYELMHNDERMLLIELIDELSCGVFEPWFDKQGHDRRPVTIEMKMMTYEELMEDRTEFIGPPQPPKFQVKLTAAEEKKLQEFADRMVSYQLGRKPDASSSD